MAVTKGTLTACVMSCIVCAVLSVASVAATLRVPSEYSTIQAGVDAAASGDSVLVAPGTWTDSETRGLRTACVFLKDGVILLSEAGPSATTIDQQGIGGGSSDVLYGVLLDSGTTAVEGFTVTGAPVGSGGAFLVDSKWVTFRGCVFRDNDGGAVTAGGVGARGAEVEFIACEFRDLTSSSAGAGISQSDASIVVDSCTFTNCADRAINCLGTNVGTPESAVIRNSTFIGNATASAR